MNDLSFPYAQFIDSLSPFAKNALIFTATTFGTFVCLAVVIYLLVRPLENRHVLAPLENMLRRCRDILIVGVSAGVAFFVAEVIKHTLSIPRPVFENGVLPLVSTYGNGFPSQHAAVFMAIAFALWFIHKRAFMIVFLAALLIALARVLVGVHSPLDILGGILLGVLSALTVRFVFDRLRK